MSRVLGLDLGTNSVGWFFYNDVTNQIIDHGSRVFEAGVNDLNQKKEQSRNATRREARERRMQARRRKFRLRLLLKFLRQFEFLEDSSIERLKEMNPYELRKAALDEPLTKEELARVFYHICRRRGFKSNRIAGKKEDKGAIFDGKADTGKRGILELREELSRNGYRTIGEYFASIDPHTIRIRNRYTERSMYFEEFNEIWNFQKKFQPGLLTDDALKAIRDCAIFYQRPLKSQKDKIGKCVFEKNKRRARRSSPEYQEFRALQDLNNLIIQTEGDYFSRRPLTLEEKEKLFKYLMEHPEVDLKTPFTTFKRAIGVPNKAKIKVNLEGKKIPGMRSFGSIKKALGEEFQTLKGEDVRLIWELLCYEEDEKKLAEILRAKWNFSEEAAAKLADVDLEPGYAALSTKAIRNILPYLREGMMYHEACAAAGYDHSFSNEEKTYLGRVPEIESIANPIVMKTLHQVRKIVNELIELHGEIDIIRIELARGLKNNLDKRLKIQEENRANEKANDLARKEICRITKRDYATKDDLERYKLWLECGKTDIYTGLHIPEDRLFGKDSPYEVDHIIPYSVSLDNSFANKCITKREINRDKGNRTPQEYLESRPEFEENFKNAVKKLPDPKAKKFNTKNIAEHYGWEKTEDSEESGFIHSQLNDTRYISRVAKKLLESAARDCVTVSVGRATSYIGDLWGLKRWLYTDEEYEALKAGSDKILKKRDDHRHHMIDAAIIAVTNRSMLQRLSTIHNRDKGQLNDDRIKFDLPWKGFVEDLKIALRNTIVSHKRNSRVRGDLHAETLYGQLKDEGGNPRLWNGKEENKFAYAVRKPITALTPKQVGNIIDPQVKKAVVERLIERGVDPENFKQPEIQKAMLEPLYLTKKVDGRPIDPKNIKPIRKARVAVPSGAMVKLRNYNVWAEPSGNHHMAIFVKENGKRRFETVSLYEAHRRKLAKKPIINREGARGEEFFMSLSRNEYLYLGDALPVGFEEDKKDTYFIVYDNLFRVQVLDVNGIIILRKHNSARTGNETTPDKIKTSYGVIEGIKMTIDCLGYLRPVNE
ncbi:MAG: type II CRISPR RNA-guided endonuclease Cas9 [Chloroflexota bacterium]